MKIDTQKQHKIHFIVIDTSSELSANVLNIGTNAALLLLLVEFYVSGWQECNLQQVVCAGSINGMQSVFKELTNVTIIAA